MGRFLLRLASLVWGLFLYALGIVLCVQANIGCAPWDVLHMGLSSKVGMTMGQMSIIVGALICLIVYLLHEKLGVGTLLNMLLIGVFMDVIFSLEVIPPMNSLWAGILVMIAGLFVIAVGSYFYMGSGFGAGPRDSLMVSLRRHTRWPVGVCRALVEGTVLLVGFFLGGQVGVGTVIAVFGIGFCVQIAFHLLSFDPAKVNHETVSGTWARLSGLFTAKAPPRGR
ncbi:MAG: hypothetical protein FWF86_02290 [Clostridia bacterium]|nr:hypothetical protein [Clostridia bacterium]